MFQLLTIAVLVILITAPIGAAAISLSAPRLLKKAETADDRKKNSTPQEEEEMNMIA